MGAYPLVSAGNHLHLRIYIIVLQASAVLNVYLSLHILIDYSLHSRHIIVTELIMIDNIEKRNQKLC